MFVKCLSMLLTTQLIVHTLCNDNQVTLTLKSNETHGKLTTDKIWDLIFGNMGKLADTLEDTFVKVTTPETDATRDEIAGEKKFASSLSAAISDKMKQSYSTPTSSPLVHETVLQDRDGFDTFMNDPESFVTELISHETVIGETRSVTDKEISFTIAPVTPSLTIPPEGRREMKTSSTVEPTTAGSWERFIQSLSTDNPNLVSFGSYFDGVLDKVATDNAKNGLANGRLDSGTNWSSTESADIDVLFGNHLLSSLGLTPGSLSHAKSSTFDRNSFVSLTNSISDFFTDLNATLISPRVKTAATNFATADRLSDKNKIRHDNVVSSSRDHSAKMITYETSTRSPSWPSSQNSVFDSVFGSEDAVTKNSISSTVKPTTRQADVYDSVYRFDEVDDLFDSFLGPIKPITTPKPTTWPTSRRSHITTTARPIVNSQPSPSTRRPAAAISRSATLDMSLIKEILPLVDMKVILPLLPKIMELANKFLATPEGQKLVPVINSLGPLISKLVPLIDKEAMQPILDNIGPIFDNLVPLLEREVPQILMADLQSYLPLIVPLFTSDNWLI
ncbi:hypothetical protein HDE_10953 [Halotydeus destructor]|nr:hypothetical protein HDE_10953 [Halotydeus destructor]